MSIWHKEVIRVNGDLKAYIEVQNEYTGTIRGSLRDIHLDGNIRYARADGMRVDVTDAYRNYLNYENRVKSGLKLLNDNAWVHSSFRE